VKSARASSLAAALVSAIAAASVALASCDLGGLTGGLRGDGGAALDASAGPDAAPAADAPAAVDAPSAGDAGVDAPRVDAGTWCAQQSPAPTFCADFDESPLVGTGWTIVNQMNGTLALDTTDFVSKPASARGTTGPVVAAGSAQASLEYDTSASGSSVHLELEVRYSQIDPGAELKTTGFAVTTAGGAELYTVYVIVAQTSAYLEESIAGDGGQIFHDTALSKIPALDQWEHLQLDVVLPTGGAPAATATVRLGPDVVLDHHPLWGGGATGNILMTAGLEVYPQSAVGPSQLEVDDVLLSVQP
jgi:hypothetical protein